MNEMAQAFNNSGITVQGQTASVSIRSIASGMGVDYIVSGKHIPDAFSPSTELWGELITTEGGVVQLEEKRMVGNVAGILLSKKKHEQLIEKYGSINMKTITQATVDNEIAMGYTNPFASSTGLNFLLATLDAYDASNILSDQAIEGFESFQTQVPFVAYLIMILALLSCS